MENQKIQEAKAQDAGVKGYIFTGNWIRISSLMHSGMWQKPETFFVDIADVSATPPSEQKEGYQSSQFIIGLDYKQDVSITFKKRPQTQGSFAPPQKSQDTVTAIGRKYISKAGESGAGFDIRALYINRSEESFIILTPQTKKQKIPALMQKFIKTHAETGRLKQNTAETLIDAFQKMKAEKAPKRLKTVSTDVPTAAAS